MITTRYLTTFCCILTGCGVYLICLCKSDRSELNLNFPVFPSIAYTRIKNKKDVNKKTKLNFEWVPPTYVQFCTSELLYYASQLFRNFRLTYWQAMPKWRVWHFQGPFHKGSIGGKSPTCFTGRGVLLSTDRVEWAQIWWRLWKWDAGNVNVRPFFAIFEVLVEIWIGNASEL